MLTAWLEQSNSKVQSCRANKPRSKLTRTYNQSANGQSAFTVLCTWHESIHTHTNAHTLCQSAEGRRMLSQGEGWRGDLGERRALADGQRALADGQQQEVQGPNSVGLLQWQAEEHVSESVARLILSAAAKELVYPQRRAVRQSTHLVVTMHKVVTRWIVSVYRSYFEVHLTGTMLWLSNKFSPVSYSSGESFLICVPCKVFIPNSNHFSNSVPTGWALLTRQAWGHRRH